MANLKLALTIQEAAAATGVGRTTIFEEIRRNQLIARKIGRRTVILQGRSRCLVEESAK